MAHKLLHGLVDTDVNKLNIMRNSNNNIGGGTNIVVNRAHTAYVLHLQNSHTLEQFSLIRENLAVFNCF